jgi:hypothetical protein
MYDNLCINKSLEHSIYYGLRAAYTISADNGKHIFNTT